MMRSSLLPTVVTLLVGAGTLPAQRFTSASGYTFAIPLGDTRDFVTTPSWIGIAWDGRWSLTPHVTASAGVSFQDFYAASFKTTNFASGAATGQQVRDLIAANFMGGIRFYPLPQASNRPYVALAAGAAYTGQYFQLGLSQVDRNVVAPAVAPEVGLEMPVMDGIDAVLSMRYTMPARTTNHIGGGARSFQYLTLGIAFAER
jgi:hypothetical protein